MDKIEKLEVASGERLILLMENKINKLVNRVNELQDALEAKPKDILVVYTPDTMSMAQCASMASSRVTEELKKQYNVVFCTSRVLNDVTFELIKAQDTTPEELASITEQAAEFNKMLSNKEI